MREVLDINSSMSINQLDPLTRPLKPGNGWPWEDPETEHVSPVDLTSTWPRISIITPSYNQGEFIEKTIRSVLQQQYPNLEYIIMDGGSTDNSVDIIKYYSPLISYWKSCPDGGQSEAINNGMNMASGDILGWINSDDYLLPGALHNVAESWCENDNLNWVSGACQFINENGEIFLEWFPEPKATLAETLSMGAGVPQPSSFWSKTLWNTVNGLDQNLHYSMDEDLWMRFYIFGARPKPIAEHLAVRFVQRNSKTSTNLPKFSKDFSFLIRKYRKNVPQTDYDKWLKGVAITSERYGIYAMKRFFKLDFSGAIDFLISGLKINPVAAIWGLIRVCGSVLKQRLGNIVVTESESKKK